MLSHHLLIIKASNRWIALVLCVKESILTIAFPVQVSLFLIA